MIFVNSLSLCCCQAVIKLLSICHLAVIKLFQSHCWSLKLKYLILFLRHPPESRESALVGHAQTLLLAAVAAPVSPAIVFAHDETINTDKLWALAIANV